MHVNLLVKPASSLCNMRCRYCFYEDEAANRTEASLGVMSRDTAALLIRQALDAAGWDGSVSFAFQGGEPTVAGLDFFRDFTAMVEAQNTARLPVAYALQTNGLALDAEWAEFLARHRFLTGISVDGDKDLHDAFRIDAAGKGTWTRVQKNLRLLQKAGVECNLLCVVTRRCAKSAVRTYHALQKTGVRYLQFIPCLDPLGEPRGRRPWSLTPEDYGAFLCSLFDEWYRDWAAGRYTSVRLFDDYVHLAMGLPAGTCATSGSCGAYAVVEGDGSVYPCDFFALDEWKLGNIHQTPLAALSAGRREQEFLQEGLDHPAPCAACRWQALCQGGCKRDWTTGAQGGRQNYYCAAFQKFFAHAEPRLRQIAAAEQRARRMGL